MTNKLNETQRALLASAAQRGDHFLTVPKGRRSVAARQAAKTLMAAGLAREVRARGEAPVWRRDKDSERAFALKLTTAGTKALAVADDGGDGAPSKPAGAVETEPQKVERPSRGVARGIAKEPAPATIIAPRTGTKINHVINMLRQPEGATFGAIIEATGWLPHTTYAALTGLRKRGYSLERSRNDAAGPSIYRLVPSLTSA
jgi:hypothetical protein